MKEYIWGVVGTIIASLSLVIQFVKELSNNRRERIAKEREEQETLLLKVCDEVEYFNGVYRIKFINTSLVATAYNLKVSIRIKNTHFNYAYKIPDFSTQEEIISINNENDQELCEIYAIINVMDIERKELLRHASSDILELYEAGKLELKDLLKDNENYLAIRYYAVNRLNGKTIEFSKHVFVYENIKHGKFGIGKDVVTPLE